MAIRSKQEVWDLVVGAGEYGRVRGEKGAPVTSCLIPSPKACHASGSVRVDGQMQDPDTPAHHASCSCPVAGHDTFSASSPCPTHLLL